MNSTKRPFDWLPTPETLAQSNLGAFIRRTGEPDLQALSRRADADPAWLMQQVFEFCDFRFYKPYEQMLDTSRGIEWARWCVGGTTSIVLNCIDRHRGTPAWEQPFLVWEGEDRRAQRSRRGNDKQASLPVEWLGGGVIFGQVSRHGALRRNEGASWCSLCSAPPGRARFRIPDHLLRQVG